MMRDETDTGCVTFKTGVKHFAITSVFFAFPLRRKKMQSSMQQILKEMLWNNQISLIREGGLINFYFQKGGI